MGAECANVSAALRAHILRRGPRIGCSRRVRINFSRTSGCGIVSVRPGEFVFGDACFAELLSNKSFRSTTLNFTPNRAKCML